MTKRGLRKCSKFLPCSCFFAPGFRNLFINHLRREDGAKSRKKSYACMENYRHRFYCHIEAGGTWGVWDRIANKPARLGGHDLLGCTSQRAEAAEGVLTRIYDSGLEALVVRIR